MNHMNKAFLSIFLCNVTQQQTKDFDIQTFKDEKSKNLTIRYINASIILSHTSTTAWYTIYISINKPRYYQSYPSAMNPTNWCLVSTS